MRQGGPFFPNTHRYSAGLSDIFLTCSSNFAKNYAIGLQLGGGASLTRLLDDLKKHGEVVEGGI